MDCTKKGKLSGGIYLWTILGITVFIALLTGGANAEVSVPLSDGFDYPVGDVNGNGQYTSPEDKTYNGWKAKYFVTQPGYIEHTGEDWNGMGDGETDRYQPVFVVSNGLVISADYGTPGFGNVILIKHQFLDGTICFSQYAHLETILVKKGDVVSRRQKIGTLGRSGLSSTAGAHLHFEIRKANMNDYSATYWPQAKGKNTQWIRDHYYYPSEFIDSHRPQTTPLIGDWNGDNIDDTGTYNPHTSIFSLSNGANLPFGELGDLPLIGDWDGDNRDTIGIYRPKTAEFFLDYNNDKTADDTIVFRDISDFPIIGDWNGDNRDTIGVYRPKTQEFFLDYNNDKITDKTIDFGDIGDFPIVGDWDANRFDDIGVFRKYDPNELSKYNAAFYLDIGHTGGKAESGPHLYGKNDDIPIVGKWDNDGSTKIGVYRLSTSQFFFNHDVLVKSSGFIVDKPAVIVDNPPVIADNSPELASIGDKSVYEKESLRFSISAKDPDGDKVIYSAENLPSGATISSTGRFTWTPGSETAGIYSIKFIATANGQTDFETITITVSKVVDNPPELALIGDRSVYEKEKLSFRVSAKDPDGDKVICSVQGLPNEAALSNSGIINWLSKSSRFTWTPGSGTAGTYPAKFIATANGLTDEETIIITVHGVVDNPPELASIGDKSVYEKESLRFSISAKDPDGDKVTYSAENLPTGATISSTGRFTWTPVSGTAGNYNVKFIATANGVIDSETITVTVNANPTKTLPEITSITPTQTVAGNFDLTINGKNFDSKTVVDQVYFNGKYVGQGTIKSRSNSKIVVTEKMTGATSGVYVVKVRNNPNDPNTESNGKELEITVAPEVPVTLSVSPNSGKQGTVFRFSGNGYTPNGDMEWHVRKPDNTEYPISILTASSSGILTYTYTSNSGSMVGTYTIWAVDKATGRKSNEVTETIIAEKSSDEVTKTPTIGSSSQKVSEPITPVTSDVTLSISPDSGPQGITFRFIGSGYTPNGVIEWHVLRPDNTKSLGKFTATGSGELIKIHESTSKNAPGTYTVWAVDKATGRKSNEVTETITKKSIIEDPSDVTLSISPDSGPQGTTFRFTGSGYTPNGVIEWYVLRPDKTQSLGKFTATGSGELIKIHESTSKNAPGTYTVWAVDKATGRKSNEVTETIT